MGNDLPIIQLIARVVLVLPSSGDSAPLRMFASIANPTLPSAGPTIA